MQEPLYSSIFKRTFRVKKPANVEVLMVTCTGAHRPNGRKTDDKRNFILLFLFFQTVPSLLRLQQ